jgi:hypothetical protein
MVGWEWAVGADDENDLALSSGDRSCRGVSSFFLQVASHALESEPDE